jgi:hypothetical protein
MSMEVPQNPADTAPMPEERRQVRLLISLNAKRKVEEIAKQNGMTEVEVASRIYLWFVEQPGVVQQGILGHLPADFREDLIELVLKRMRKG